MRVAFDSRAKGDPRGIGRYVRCLLEALRETAAEGNVIAETAPPARAATSSTARGSTARSCAAPAPTVVTLHDLVNLKRRSEYLRTGVRFRLRYLAVAARRPRDRADARPSPPTRRSASTSTRERISVIAEAAAPRRCTRAAREEIAAVRARYGLPDRVPAVGRRAAAPRAAQARRRARRRRRGGCRSCSSGPARQWAHELPDVTLTGQVTDDELAAIYSGAHALVFPSDDEGFGLPTVEALACGTPVVACEAPARARGARRPRDVRRASATSRGCSRPAPPPTRPAPAPPQWSWARRRARDLGGLRRGAAPHAGAQNAPRPQITAGSVLTRIVRSRKTDQRSR